MRITHVKRTDLNLLPALAALLEHRHVSQAADEVGLSQPAMSRSLGRLRKALDDELLVRTPGGYRLTRRAERINGELDPILRGLETLLAGETFDPSAAAEAFELVGSDYAVSVLGGRLFEQLVAASPASTLRFHGWHEGSFDELREGVRDLVFLGGPVPDDLHSERLFLERFVCVVACDHHLADRTALALDEYIAESHLVIEVTDGAQPAIDRPLAELGQPRRTGLRIPYHASAPRALHGTALIATLPERLVTAYIDERFRILGAPSEVAMVASKAGYRTTSGILVSCEPRSPWW